MGASGSVLRVDVNRKGSFSQRLFLKYTAEKGLTGPNVDALAPVNTELCLGIDCVVRRCLALALLSSPS